MAPVEPRTAFKLKLGALLLLMLFLSLIAIVIAPACRFFGARVERGPLRPLTPPFTVDKLALLADVSAHRFKELDKKLADYQARAERDVRQEANAHMAFETFGANDPSLDQPLQDWVAMAPDSYAAHLARAEYLSRRGWEARAWPAPGETSDQQLARIEKLMTAAAREDQTALKLNPRLADGWQVLIEVAKLSYGPTGCLSAARGGLAQAPASFTVRAAVIECLEPRWRGSYDRMERFADESQALAAGNPRLVVLKGYPDLDRGNLQLQAGDYAAAVKDFRRALAAGGDDSAFYYGRGLAFTWMQHFADALEDLDRANRLWPQSPRTLQALASVFEQTGRYPEALKEIDLALQIGGTDSYNQRLRARVAAQVKAASSTRD